MRLGAISLSLLFLAYSCKLMTKEDEKVKLNPPSMNTRFKALAWTHNTNIYEVNLRQYTSEGTINAFASHLQRLKEMGVRTLWFMPLTPIARQNMKGSLGSYYACSSYIGINPEFGTTEDFKALVNTAHQLNFKVIIDWVANHTGWDHEWTKSHPGFYLMDSATKDFKIASGMDDIIELDYKNPEMRKAMIDAMKWWVKECDIDGFRCDLAFWVELPFWKQARKELDAIKPLFWLGEFDELENPKYGEAFDASYTWTWMHRAKDFYEKNQALDSLYAVIKKYDDLGDSTMRAWFTTNHDENSWNGTEYEKYGDMAKTLAVFSCTWSGIPLIYSGQEIPNKKRLEFFEKDPLTWPDSIQLENFYRILFTLKTNNPALGGGDPKVQTYRIKTSDSSHIFSYLRKKEEHEVLVVLNLSKTDMNIEITDPRLMGTFRNTFTNKPIDFSNQRSFNLNAWGWLVLEK